MIVSVFFLACSSLMILDRLAHETEAETETETETKTSRVELSCGRWSLGRGHVQATCQAQTQPDAAKYTNRMIDAVFLCRGRDGANGSAFLGEA
jgi:hypothetical protein